GSTDAGPALIAAWWRGAEWPGSELIQVSVPGAYPGGARNAGIARATAPWIAFLDAGVIPEPPWLEQLLLCAGNGHGALGLCTFSATGAFACAVCALGYGSGAAHPVLPASLFAQADVRAAGRFRADLRAGEDRLWLAAFTRAAGPLPTCPQARARYTGFPVTMGRFIRKTFVYARHAAAAGLQLGTTTVLAVIALAIAGATAWSPLLGGLTFATYLFARGVLDPAQRSGAAGWWKPQLAALLWAILLAPVGDLVRLVGALAGLVAPPPVRDQERATE
ncbi:MAG: glycosyltransferase, partial [Burkholderiales bacterium]